MDRIKLHLAWAVPVLVLAALVAAVAGRKEESLPEKRSRKPFIKQEASAVSPASSAASPRIPAPPPPPMPEDLARIYPVYQDFRTAVALGHSAHRDALHKVLSRNREAALRLAEEELDAARDETGRSIAERTLEALRR